MIEDLTTNALSEYGLLVALLLFAVYVLYRRNVQLGDKTLAAMIDSTKILTELKQIIRGKYDK